MISPNETQTRKSGVYFVNCYVFSTGQSRYICLDIVACAMLSDSIVRTYLNEQSENKTRATWERGKAARKMGERAC